MQLHATILPGRRLLCKLTSALSPTLGSCLRGLVVFTVGVRTPSRIVSVIELAFSFIAWFRYAFNDLMPALSSRHTLRLFVVATYLHPILRVACARDAGRVNNVRVFARSVLFRKRIDQVANPAYGIAGWRA